MTKREALRQTQQENTLINLGFTRAEAESLRRISMTLHRWHELECGVDGGGVERDETTGKTVWYSQHTGRRTPFPDRETGAKKRLQAIIDARNSREVRHTACDRCGLDIEGVAPFNEWRDRGNNAGDEHHRHAPAKDDGSYGPVAAYIQGDPRGAALYILRPGDVPEGKDADAYYTRGICVY